jgi:hypothetical protein
MLTVVGRQTNRLGPAAEAAYPGPLEQGVEMSEFTAASVWRRSRR